MDECLALSAKCYGDLDGRGILKVPRGKGNRHNILHAGGKGGWIPNLPLIVFDNAKYHIYRLESCPIESSINSYHLKEYFTRLLRQSSPKKTTQMTARITLQQYGEFLTSNEVIETTEEMEMPLNSKVQVLDAALPDSRKQQ